MADASGRMLAFLTQRQVAGDLGPAPIEAHVQHALAFAAQVAEPPGHAVDLGTGGGVPGLVLAVLRWPDTRWTFVEVRQARAAHLRDAIREFGLTDRVAVVEARVEELGRSAAHRGEADLVTSRSFGKPAVVAECAAPLLRTGGALVVSEPPAGTAPQGRWSAEALAVLGLSIMRTVAGPPAFVVLRQDTPCPARFPRRPGKPERAPLF